MKKSNNSISAILLGDSVGALIESLDTGDMESAIIVINVKPGGIIMAYSESLGLVELVGALSMAVDKVRESY